MLKTIALAAVASLGLNKLAYHALLKSPPKLKTKILGQGHFITLSYNPISHQWSNGLKSDNFSTLPNTNLYHIQDFLLINTQYPACFRLRPCYLNLSKKLSEYNLSVIPIKTPDLSDLSDILLNYSSKTHSIIRANLWEEAENHTLSFAPVEINKPSFVHLKVENAQTMQGINACDRFLLQFQGEILQGVKFSVFFIKGNKVVSPEARHPVESPFVVKESVMRDSVLKIVAGVEEKITNLDEFQAGFIASESFAMAPIRSIEWGGKKVEFEINESKNIIEKVEKFMTDNVFKNLAEDGFTVEKWLEDLRLVQNSG